MFCRVAEHLCKRGYIFGYDGSGTYECIGPNGDAAYNGGIRANTCTTLHQGRPEFQFTFNKCSGIDDVGEYHRWTDKDILFQYYSIIERYIVLNLAAAPDFDLVIDENILSEDTVVSHPGAGHEMAKMPDPGTGTDFSTGIDYGSGVDEGGGCFFHSVDFNKYANFRFKLTALTTIAQPAGNSGQRFFSLDVFRGATVAFMILVNNQPGASYSPLHHAPWHGCTPTDLVFPFFLFAVGNAIAFVLPKLEAMNRSAAVWKIVKRGILIFLIGLLLNWFPFVKWENGELVGKSFETLRIFGVLQRIALAYLFGALIIYFFKARLSFLIAALLLLGYWVLTVMAGDPADPYSLEGFWGTGLDRVILGENHMYKGEGVAFDPEGIASTIPSVAQVILGFLVGDYIRQKGKNSDMVANLFVAGVVLWLAGMAWGLSFPINKKIWTSSYVLYTVGLATLILATLIQLIEFRGWKGVVPNFFDAFGKNPLFIYVLSGVIPKSMWLIRIPNGVTDAGEPKFTNPMGWFYEYICKPISNRLENAALLYSLSLIFLLWLIAWYMNKRRWYVRV